MANATLLPDYLSERTRKLIDVTASAGGEFVLYWMHHAARAHENPALDAAILVGNSLGIPVLVYQGLGGNHRFNSDRHHAFIMQGAREVQQTLQRRDIAYAFCLSANPKQATPLRDLAERAALVITEDFPAPPFPRWTQSLAERVATPIWLVDCACIAPMQSLSKRYTRAFEFRKAVEKEFEARLGQEWYEQTPHVPRFGGDLGFEPVDLVDADIASLCARCDIDHSIGPVVHTHGGSTAGYVRWELFKKHGLKSYAKLRNDAALKPPLGVSRLSPYLHHGHVSPFRIAKDAAEMGGSGAQKFLDELLVWRELAHNFCFSNQSVESLEALPSWARSTLTDHSIDPREAVYTWEELARGRTGDSLWDAAQRSLLIHGELHNNVRMTWGKALLGWTKKPEEALRMLIDLNHRYALDGNDPNSYGGLLWCLGQFDRPFKPELPVLGTVRPRSTHQHARRLNLDVYKNRVTDRADKLRIAVIGAGIAGLCAARTLQDQGHQVRIFEKSGRPGGRAATRRSRDYAFDHGAQYFTVTNECFRRHVDSWVEADVVRQWQGRVAAIANGSMTLKGSAAVRYVGVPGMDAVAHHLGSDLDIKYRSRVCALERDEELWHVRDDGEENPDSYNAVLVTTPPAQAIPLLAAAPAIAKRAGTVEMVSCWSVMAVFETPLDSSIDGAFVHNAPLSWIARNDSKPRRSEHESWVLHASPEWSAENLNVETNEAAEALLTSFFKSMNTPPARPVFLQAHRWRFSMAKQSLSEGCLWNDELAVGVCGDWCLGSKIESAFLSGVAAAGRILNLSSETRES